MLLKVLFQKKTKAEEEIDTINYVIFIAIIFLAIIITIVFFSINYGLAYTGNQVNNSILNTNIFKY